jgi:hypothetical protein
MTGEGKNDTYAAAILDNEDVKKLLGIMEANNVSTKDLLYVFSHVNAIERQLEAATKELSAIRLELQKSQEQNTNENTMLQKPVAVMQEHISNMQDKLVRVKQRIITGCKKAASNFEKTGVTALNNVVRSLKIKSALESLREDLNKTIHASEESMAKIETISGEYHEAGKHVHNMVRTLAGNESVQEAKPMGHLAEALKAPFQAVNACLASTNKNLESILSKIDHLEQMAGRQESAEAADAGDAKMPAAKETASEDTEFFGKIVYPHGDGPVDTVLYKDKLQYSRDAHAKDEYNINLTATEITKDEYLTLKQQLETAREKQRCLNQESEAGPELECG